MYLLLIIMCFNANNKMLDFSAKWCRPCQQMSPIIAELIKEGYNIEIIDTDDTPAMVVQYKINSLPTFILLRDKVEKRRIIGVLTKKKLIEFYNSE